MPLSFCGLIWLIGFLFPRLWPSFLLVLPFPLQPASASVAVNAALKASEVVFNLPQAKFSPGEHVKVLPPGTWFRVPVWGPEAAVLGF